MMTANELPIEIVTDRDILTKKSEKTTWEEIKKLSLIERLKDGLNYTWTKGVGLAAIQIGVPLQVAYYKIEGKDKTLVNPRIIRMSGAGVCAKEGCLSIPNQWFRTMRYGQVLFETETEVGKKTYAAFGMEAVIIQHEIDHMNGVLSDMRIAPPEKKIGRNDLCHCGSGKKYKKCCLEKEGTICLD